MRKLLKIILSILAGLLLLGVATLVTVPFMVDLNDFKAEIEAVVQNNTGRVLTIDGEVSLSIFPWLGITTGKMTLNNAEGFKEQAFAQINESQIKVKLLPLLFKQVEVSEIVLKGLNLTLLKNSQGIHNWDDLAALLADEQNQTENPLKLLEIAGLLIENAQVTWHNQQTGKKLTLQNFNCRTDKLVFNQPFEIAFAVTAQGYQPDFTETLDFSGELTLNKALDDFKLQKIKLQSQTQADFIPTGQLIASLLGDVHFDLHQQQFDATALQLKTGALTLDASTFIARLQPAIKISGLLHIPNFDATEVMQRQFALTLPTMADEKALTWLAADFHLDADENRLKLQNISLQIDETTATGSAQISLTPQLSSHFNLTLDAVNFDRYLPPPEINNAGQSLNAPASTVASKVTLFSVEKLRNLNLNGQVLINDLKLNNLTMQEVKLSINSKNGILQSLQSVNRLYQGSYSSKIALDVNSDLPVLTLQQQFSHLQIEPFLTDLKGQSELAGIVDMNLKLEAQGNSEFALKSSVNGQVNFLGKNILLRGFNLQKLIDNGKIWLSSNAPLTSDRKEQTLFSKVSGTAIVSNGFLNNNDLSAATAKAKVGGMGVINLVSQQLDYKIIAMLLKEKVTASHTKVLNSIPVFINIGGSLNAPVYQVDLAAMGVGL